MLPSHIGRRAAQIPGDLASRPVIKEVLQWKPSHLRRRSHASASTSSAGGENASGHPKGGGLFEKPKPLENKFLTKVKSSHRQPVDSPESFQDRMKRLTREKRKSQMGKNNKIVLKKEEEVGLVKRSSKSGAISWNKRFLKRYGLVSKNLFAP